MEPKSGQKGIADRHVLAKAIIWLNNYVRSTENSYGSVCIQRIFPNFRNILVKWFVLLVPSLSVNRLFRWHWTPFVTLVYQLKMSPLVYPVWKRLSTSRRSLKQPLLPFSSARDAEKCKVSYWVSLLGVRWLFAWSPWFNSFFVNGNSKVWVFSYCLFFKVLENA